MNHSLRVQHIDVLIAHVADLGMRQVDLQRGLRERSQDGRGGRSTSPGLATRHSPGGLRMAGMRLWMSLVEEFAGTVMMAKLWSHSPAGLFQASHKPASAYIG